MNLVEISETLKGAPDDFLIKHVQNPDGSVPQFMALSELQRRKDMRDRFAGQSGPQSTVADDLTKGIAPAAPQAPQMAAPQMGPEMAGPEMGAPQMPQAGIQGYAGGGGVGSYIDRVGGFESGNNPNAKNPYSTASGRYQFLDSTRAALDKRYGFDPRDRSAATERARMEAYTNETAAALRKNNLPVSGGTLYGGHLLGQGGVTNFLKAYQNNPNAKPSEVFSAEVIKKNPAIFGKARTLADVMEKFDKVGGEGVPSGIKDRKDIAGRKVSDKNMSGILSLLSEDYEPTEGPSALEGVMKMIEGSGDGIMKMGSEQHAKVLKSLGVPGYAGGGTAGMQKTIVQNGIEYTLGADGLYADKQGRRPVGMQADHRVARKIAKNQNEYYKSLLPEELSPEWSIQEDDTGLTQIGKSLGQLGYNALKVAALPGNALVGGPLASFMGGAFQMGGDLKDWMERTPAERKAARSGIAAAPSKWTDVQLERPPGYGPETTTPDGIKTAVTQPAPEILPPAAPPQVAPAADPLDTIINDFLAEHKASKQSPEERKQMALLSAGLGMMSGESPWAAVNIGRGGLAGVAAYQDAKKSEAQMAESALNNALKIQALRGQTEDRRFERQYKTELLNINKARANAYIESLAARVGQGGDKMMTKEQYDTYQDLIGRLVQAKTEMGQEVTYNDIMQAADLARAGATAYEAVPGAPSGTRDYDVAHNPEE